ncbi:MAG: cell division protein FtsQ/DivIB [Cyanobacteriota bacterium]
MTESRAPAAERRAQLRRDKRLEQLRNLWRIVVFSAAGVGLASVLLRQGWRLDSVTQLEVVGSRLVSRDQVAEAADLHFPQPLLSLQPRQLAERITAALPVDQVQVTRLMLPPRLRIQLVDREAVARAERRGPHGPEPGYVDRLGHWMAPHQQGRLTAVAARRIVRGWQPEHRPALALLFRQQDRLGGAMEEIDLQPDGTLSVRIQPLGMVRLGQGLALLPQRLEVLSHLSMELPARLQGRHLEAIDLTDPQHPELSLPAPVKPGDRLTTAPARD